MLDILLHPPMLFRVLGSLAAILVLHRVTARLALSLTGGTLLLILSTGTTPDSAASVIARLFTSRSTIGLLCIIVLVVTFCAQMQETGVMHDLVAAVQGMAPGRPAFAVLPAAIGLLPMPGGALFSAPLVERCDADGRLPAELKTAINYWFRHIWEYFWPLYPGVLLAVEISGLDIWKFMLVQVPLSGLSVLCGAVFLLRKVPHEAGRVADRPDPDPSAANYRRRFLALMAPVFAIVVVYGVVRVAFPALAAWNKYLPMMMGLFAGAALLQWHRPLPANVWGRLLVRKRTWVMVMIVAMVRVYGAFVVNPLSDGMTMVEHIRMELEAWRIPATALVMLIPFVAGLTTGLALGFVGASFPIVLSLGQAGVAGPAALHTVVLAYASGYVGMLLSPVHVCLIVTNEHFRTRLSRSLADLLPPALTLLLLASLYAAAIRFLFPAVA